MREKLSKPFLTTAVDTDRLINYSGYFRRALPEVMIKFVVAFLDRLQGLFGLRFVIALPNFIRQSETTTLSIFRDLEWMVDEGIVHSYAPVPNSYEDEPLLFNVQVDRVSGNRSEMVGYGRSLFSYEESWGPAYGESIERWAVDQFDPTESERLVQDVVQLRENSLLDVNSLPGITSSVRQSSNNSRRYKINESDKFTCVKVEELTSKSEMFAPLQFFSFKHARRAVNHGQEPVLLPLVTTGFATGRSLEEATFGALSEAIERDAFMIHWVRKIVPDQVDISLLRPKALERIKRIQDRYQLETYFLWLRSDFPIPVIACVMIDRSGVGPAVTVDTCANVDVATAMEKSFLGATALRPFIRRRKHELGDQKLDPFLLDMSERGVWWADKERLSDIEFLISGDSTSSLERYEEKKLDDLLTHCVNKSYLVYRKEILPERIKKKLGLTVVGVKVPNLQPLHLDEQEAALDGERLKSVPEDLQLKSTLDCNTVPHPFV